jgi:hypothetical protein
MLPNAAPSRFQKELFDICHLIFVIGQLEIASVASASNQQRNVEGRTVF